MSLGKLCYRAGYDGPSNRPCVVISYMKGVLEKETGPMSVTVMLHPDGVVRKTGHLPRDTKYKDLSIDYYFDGVTLEFPGNDWREDFKGRTLIFTVCRADDTVYAEVQSPNLEDIWCYFREIDLELPPKPIQFEDNKESVKNLIGQFIKLKASLDEIEEKIYDHRKCIAMRHQIERREVEDDHKKELEQFLKAQKYELDKLENKQNKEIEEIENHLTEYKKKKTGMNFRIPDCPVCFEELRAPLKIFNCTNGHLICEKCRDSVSVCTLCRDQYCGRATEMEKFIQSVLEEN